MFLEVNVDGVRPITSALELPNLSRVSFDSKANIVAIKEFIVDDPLAVPPVEFEATRDPFCHSRRHLIEGGVGSRINAVVCYGDQKRHETQAPYSPDLPEEYC